MHKLKKSRNYLLTEIPPRPRTWTKNKHDAVMTRSHFSNYLRFERGIRQSLVVSLHKWPGCVFIYVNLNKLLSKLSSCWYQILNATTLMWHQSEGHGGCHYCDVIMSAMASQITSASIVYSTVCSSVDQIKHQSSASLTFVREFTGDR